MANKSVTLHNDDNDNLYPNTTASLVYMTNGNTVESEITNIKEQNPNKGFYSTPSELYEVYPDNIQDPNTRAGWFVTMGSTDTIWLWDVEGNKWQNSFNKPSDVNSVNGQTGDVVLTGNNINATATVGVDSVTKSVDAHLTDLYTNKVDKTTTIAGVDLQDNITSNELYTGLGLGTVATHNVSTNGVGDNDSSIPTASQIKTYVAENGGKIDSISAGGTALTIDANKNVNIPIAENGPDDGGDAGVVKLQGTHYAGIAVNPTTKNMSIAETTDSDTFWNNRKSYGFAVKGSNLDKYLKLALGSTSSESDNTTTWTDTNKTNACNKIGASSRGIARL